MKVTLLNKTNSGFTWIQDLICDSVEDARKFADETEKVNSNKIKVVIAEDTSKKGIGVLVYNPVIIG